MESPGKIIRGPPLPEVPDISLSEHLLRSMRTYSDCNILTDARTGKSTTNGEILERSVKMAGVLETYGIKMNDIVSIAAENHPNWLIPVWATLYLGAVIVPVNPAYTECEFRHYLNLTKPRIIFVSHHTEGPLLKIAPDLPWKIEIIQLDDVALSKGIPTMKDLLRNHTKLVDPYEYKPVPIGDSGKQLAAILSSSGTTGLPKGVMVSHRNLLLFIHIIITRPLLDIRQNDKLLVILPYYNGYAFGLLMAAMSTGATAVSMQSFEMQGVLESIGKHRITHLPIVPPILLLLAKHPTLEDYDFSSVRELICGSAPVPRGIADIVKKRTGCGFIRNGYGMTELSITACMSDRSPDDDGNVGYVVPGMMCKVIDQVTQETLGVGQTGELCFKGGRVMLGYYDNPQVTAEAIDEEGWLHTGDLGYYDDKERFYITGRLKELVKYKGFQVSPSEIEAVLLSHSGVKDAAVVGKPDEVAGELPMAFVVAQPGSSVSEKELLELVSGKLSSQNWLRGGVKFIEAIPKNPTGKILRRELLKMIPEL